MKNSDVATMTFWQHMQALRSAVLRSLVIIGSALCLCLCFHQQIVSFFLSPLSPEHNPFSPTILNTYRIESKRICNVGLYAEVVTLNAIQRAQVLPTSEKIEVIDPYTIRIQPSGHLDYQESCPAGSSDLLILSPTEGMQALFILCFWVSIIFSAPFWGLIWLQFVEPAFKDAERKYMSPILKTLFIALSIGIPCALYFLIPLFNSFFLSFNSSIGVNQWTFRGYIEYSWLLVAASCLSIELMLLLGFSVFLGWIKAQELQEKRRYFILFAFIFGALVTPPDVPSQVMVAVPLILFYEISIAIALCKEKKKAIYN